MEWSAGKAFRQVPPRMYASSASARVCKLTMFHAFYGVHIPSASLGSDPSVSSQFVGSQSRMEPVPLQENERLMPSHTFGNITTMGEYFSPEVNPWVSTYPPESSNMLPAWQTHTATVGTSESIELVQEMMPPRNLEEMFSTSGMDETLSSAPPQDVIPPVTSQDIYSATQQQNVVVPRVSKHKCKISNRRLSCIPVKKETPDDNLNSTPTPNPYQQKAGRKDSNDQLQAWCEPKQGRDGYIHGYDANKPVIFEPNVYCYCGHCVDKMVNLKAHIRYYTQPQEIVSCNYCKREYATQHSLARHMVTVHKSSKSLEKKKNTHGSNRSGDTMWCPTSIDWNNPDVTQTH